MFTMEDSYTVLCDIKAKYKIFRKACSEIILLNNKIEEIKSRFDRAKAQRRLSFRISNRLKLTALEGVRNLIYEYACAKCEEIEQLQARLQALTGDAYDFVQTDDEGGDDDDEAGDDSAESDVESDFVHFDDEAGDDSDESDVESDFVQTDDEGGDDDDEAGDDSDESDVESAADGARNGDAEPSNGELNGNESADVTPPRTSSGTSQTQVPATTPLR